MPPSRFCHLKKNHKRVRFRSYNSNMYESYYLHYMWCNRELLCARQDLGQTTLTISADSLLYANLRWSTTASVNLIHHHPRLGIICIIQSTASGNALQSSCIRHIIAFLLRHICPTIPILLPLHHWIVESKLGLDQLGQAFLRVITTLLLPRSGQC